MKSIFDSGHSIRVGILLYPEVEVLDFAGPFEVFSVASRVAKRDLQLSVPSFDVSTVATRKEMVLTRHGLKVLPDHGIADAPIFNLLIVPGGIVTQPLHDQEILDYISMASSQSLLTASVCTGAFLLAKVGLLDGQEVTTHWEDIPDLCANFPSLKVIEDVPFVDNGNIVTSAGISAGIGMSLHLVGRILGEKIALDTARQMQFDWKPS